MSAALRASSGATWVETCIVTPNRECPISSIATRGGTPYAASSEPEACRRSWKRSQVNSAASRHWWCRRTKCRASNSALWLYCRRCWYLTNAGRPSAFFNPAGTRASSKLHVTICEDIGPSPYSRHEPEPHPEVAPTLTVSARESQVVLGLTRRSAERVSVEVQVRILG